MSLFCLLWVPFFYLFRRAVTGNAASSGGVWAFLAGSAAALLQFFLGNLVTPEGFGISRWLSGCVDIVVLPALLPLLVYLALVCSKTVSGNVDFANFALLWLIPSAVTRAVSWGSLRDPVLLVLVPLLWTAIAAGIPFFIGLIARGKILVIIPSSLAILAVPCAASFSYWAFYAQKLSLGYLFLAAAALPMLISLLLSFLRADN